MLNVNPLRALSLSVIAAAVSFAASTASAGTINLLASGTQQWSSNTTNTTFSLNDIQTAGSGAFNPFVRIQGSNKTNDNEQGYNTSSPSSTMQNASNGPANPLIQFNQVVNSSKQINLALDVNEPGGSQSTITLENLMLIVSTNANKSGPAGTDPFTVQSVPSDPGDKVLFNMLSPTTTRTDAGHVGESFNIGLDSLDNLANGNGGSGQADLLVQLDLSGVDLSGLYDANHYLYVYSRLSNGQGGYEEWRIQTPNPNDRWNGGNPPPTPEPASLGLLGMGAAGLLFRRRRV